MSAPAVSVCIPTYRGAPHVGATIESVLAQTFEDFELIVVDDGSPDETAAVVARYRDPRIRFAQNKRNLGAEANWNRCVEMVRGRYVKLLPQDDLLAPECLARQVAVLEADIRQHLALVFCARSIIDADSQTIMRRGFPSRRSGEIAGRDVIRSCIRRGANLIGEPGSVLLRTALAKRVGRFDGSLPYVIDLDYWFRLLLHGNAYYVADTLASFRVSRGSWSVALGRNQSAQFRDFIAKVALCREFGVRRIDLGMGTLMAPLNAALRMLVYRAVLD
jgi:glycosyltransferase involved in cell wall biosynthesis